MKDQASVGEETPAIKYDRALSLFTESVMKPDHDLRGCAPVSYTHLTLPTTPYV